MSNILKHLLVWGVGTVLRFIDPIVSNRTFKFHLCGRFETFFVYDPLQMKSLDQHMDED